MKKYIITIAVTGTAEVEVEFSPEEEAEYKRSYDTETTEDFILDKVIIKPEDIDYSDGLAYIDREEIS